MFFLHRADEQSDKIFKRKYLISKKDHQQHHKQSGSNLFGVGTPLMYIFVSAHSVKNNWMHL